MNSKSPRPAAGLDGVVAAETHLSEVDGLAGRLTIAGYPVEQLALNASNEQVAHLLWFGSFPGDESLASELRARRDLSPLTIALLHGARDAAPMDALIAGASTLGLEPAPEGSPDERARALACRLTAALPTIVAAHWRARQGLDPVAPDPALGRAANFLLMLDGAPPTRARAAALETYLNAVVEHGMNASTFTARVITSTRSDLASAVVGALGALKGPLHGGAPGPVLDTLRALEREPDLREALRRRIRAGERLMGFGHRVYRVRDPRAQVLATAARRLAAGGEREELFTHALAVERAALEVLREHKPDRALETNVEFYTALLLDALGIDRQLFTPVFAIGRVIGWIAHCFEQRANGRLLRPRARYVGARHDSWPHPVRAA